MSSEEQREGHWRRLRQALEEEAHGVGGFGTVQMVVTFHRGLPTKVNLTRTEKVVRLDADN